MKKEALELTSRLDRTIAANSPSIYLYYVGDRIVKLGFSKDVMGLRNSAHQRDSDFSECILLALWPASNSVEVEIHKQLKYIRTNKAKTGKRELYTIQEDSTLIEFIEMIGKYVEKFTHDIKTREENIVIKNENYDLKHKLELLSKDLELSKKDLELSAKNNEIASTKMRFCLIM